MRSPAKPPVKPGWDADEVRSTGERHALHFRDALRRAEDARTDRKAAQRHAMRECRWCWYFAHGLAGQAFTAYTCSHCAEECMHPNTAVPVLCDECGDELDACVRCGGAMEWK